MRRIALLAVVALLSWSPTAAGATGILDDFLTITQEGVGSMTLSGEDLGCQVTESEDGGPLSFSCDGSGETFVPGNPSFTWMLSNWDVSGEFDPFVSQAFGFRNTGATATFTITTSIPVAPLGPTTVMGGSTGGSVTDANFDGVGGLTTSAPDPFYVGLIDGVPVVGAALHPDPFSVGFAFPGDTASIPSTSFGLPGPTTPGPAVTTSIGIRNRFTLSGGDSVASTNFFVVEVPEPTIGALIGLGLMAGLSLGRRR